MDNKDMVHSRVYRLIEPGKFEEVMLQHTVGPTQAMVQPSLASICHADNRYYIGQRRKEALQKKLPIAFVS